MADKPNKEAAFKLLICALAGICLGLGVYTVHYAKGLSYLSNDPKACMNCHIMKPQYEGWTKSSHHNVATCNDCHAPHDFFGKYLTKAENGYHHSVAFTLQNFHEPIIIHEKNEKILNEACLSCHKALVDSIAPHRLETNSCTRCHATVGHGAK